MNHYDALKVDKTATEEEIKKAYRKRSREAHPDKGGDSDEMALVNRAYDCLSNPQRRARYDESGQDSATPSLDPEAVAVRNILMMAFDALIQSGRNYNRLDFVRGHITNQILAISANIGQVKEQKEKLEVLRGKVTTKSTENYFEMVLNQKIAGAEHQIRALEEQVNYGKKAIELLNEYKSNGEASGGGKTEAMMRGGVAYIDLSSGRW